MEQTNITHLRQELSLIEDSLNDSDNFINENNWSRDYWISRSERLKENINSIKEDINSRYDTSNKI